MTPQSFSMQPPSPDTSSWQAVSDFSPLSPDVLSAPPTPTSRDTPRLISEETQSSVSDSGYEETVSDVTGILQWREGGGVLFLFSLPELR